MNKAENQRSTFLTVSVMACTLGSRILGFVRTAAIGALFGAGGAADVINLIYSIPNNLRKLLAEGALSTAFIPELSRQIAADGSGDSAKNLTRNITGFQAVIILPILAACLFFPDQVLNIFEQFSDVEKQQLSRVLFRWMMPYFFLVSISAVMTAVHNTYDKFIIPALTPIVFSISVISSLVFGYSRWGVISMGYGVLIGGVAQILVQYPGYRRLGYRLSPLFRFRDPNFVVVMKRWAPMLLTASLFTVNNQIAMLLASFLPDRNASSLSYAIVFFQLPFGIFSASISTVLYPRMSRQAALKDKTGLLESLGFGYRNLWALLLPSGMAMIALGEPIIAMAFQRQAFTLADTLLTAQVLTAYSVGMPFIGLFNITQRAFYAAGEVRKPFYCALATVAIDIVLSLVFVFFFDGGSELLAWANSFAFIFGAILQYCVLHQIMGFSLKGLTIRTFVKVFFATAFGFVIIFMALKTFGTQWWEGGSHWGGLGILMGIILTTSVVVLGLYFWMKIEVVSMLFKRSNK